MSAFRKMLNRFVGPFKCVRKKHIRMEIFYMIPDQNHRYGQRSEKALSEYSPVTGNPEGLEILEAESMGSYREIPFVLTPGISYIDGEAFTGSEISAFEQSGENPYYSVRDGVLYNADGTVLVRYPGSNSAEEFTVPEGVVSIGEGAFNLAMNLKKVVLPDSLKEIGRHAFKECSSLEEITPVWISFIIGSAALSSVIRWTKAPPLFPSEICRKPSCWSMRSASLTLWRPR